MGKNNKNQKNNSTKVEWDLGDLYPSPDSDKLKSDRQRVIQLADTFSETYRGTVQSLSVDAFAGLLEKYEEIIELLGRIGSYSYLLWTTNTEDPKLGSMVQQANELSSEINQKLVFFEVEWLQIKESKAETFITSNALSKYTHFLETSRKQKPHILEEKQEQIMSAKSVTGRSAWVRFFDETQGASRVKLDGEQLTQQQALSKLHESDRSLRERAQQALTDTFRENSRTTTYIFNTILADKQTNDRLRNYQSWISSRNLSNEIDNKTVERLIEAVTGSYSLVQRFYRLKKSLLNYDTLYDYDRYAPIIESQKEIDWQQARSLVQNSYTEFHPEMGAITDKFFDKSWIDAAIKPGKRGGAYSASTVPSVHPYVFMNFDGKLRDVQTLAHELGHGVHQYLSREQGILEADTPLTTAETASVFGERLVFENILKTLDDPKEKLALLMSKIDDTIATVYRQISMNRFEDAIHNERREQGERTTERFGELWMNTQNKLYGDSVTLTDNYSIWWSYIPHFLHTPGYVYAYAFGELLVLALYEEYTQNPDGFADNYLNLLRKGGSDWPENIVAEMGLDITDPDFWDRGIASIEQLVTWAESLASNINSHEEKATSQN